MKTYEKIETVYARDIEGTKKLIPGKYRNETVEFLKDCRWLWTEKVDGRKHLRLVVRAAEDADRGRRRSGTMPTRGI